MRLGGAADDVRPGLPSCPSSALGGSVGRGCAERASLGLDDIPDRGGEIRATQALDCAQSRGRGHLDLRQEAVDHVDADEDEPAALQLRTYAGADFALAWSERGFPAAPPRTMLERTSSTAGTRLTAPSGSPSTRTIRLSPWATAGMNFWMTHGSRNVTENRSKNEPKLASRSSILNTAAPP